MSDEKKLKTIIFYQEKIKLQLQNIYNKDEKTFSREYGILLMQEALYQAKSNAPNYLVEELSNHEKIFKENFKTLADNIINNYFNQKDNKSLDFTEALKILGMEQEFEQVKNLDKNKLEKFYNINRIKADKVIFEAAVRANSNIDDKISLINRLTRRNLERMIENDAQIEDLKLTYIILEIANIAVSSKKLLNICNDKTVRFSINMQDLQKIKLLLDKNDISYNELVTDQIIIIDKSLVQNKNLPKITINFTDETGEVFVSIEGNNQSLLNNVMYILGKAIKPPPLIKKKIIRNEINLEQLQNLNFDNIEMMQLAD